MARISLISPSLPSAFLTPKLPATAPIHTSSQQHFTPAITNKSRVSWPWNGSHPSGTASEVKPGSVTVTSHRGNDITKTGDESNPAVHIARSGNDVVKTADELKVESKAESNGNTAEKSNGTTNGAEPVKQQEPEKKQEEKKEPEQAHTGEKRTADERPEEKKAEDTDAKKQKTTNGTDAKTNGNGTAANGKKKKSGPPKGGNAPKKEKKVPAVWKTQRKTRSQGFAESVQV
jgi:hypothetical protein